MNVTDQRLNSLTRSREFIHRATLLPECRTRDREIQTSGKQGDRSSAARKAGPSPSRNRKHAIPLLGIESKSWIFLKLQAFLEHLRQIERPINVVPTFFRNPEHALNVEPLIWRQLVECVIR